MKVPQQQQVAAPVKDLVSGMLGTWLAFVWYQRASGLEAASDRERRQSDRMIGNQVRRKGLPKLIKDFCSFRGLSRGALMLRITFVFLRSRH